MKNFNNFFMQAMQYMALSVVDCLRLPFWPSKTFSASSSSSAAPDAAAERRQMRMNRLRRGSTFNHSSVGEHSGGESTRHAVQEFA